MNLLDTAETFKIEITLSELDKVKNALEYFMNYLEKDSSEVTYYYMEIVRLYDETTRMLSRDL